MERSCLTCTAPDRNNLHTSGIGLSDSPDSNGPVRSVTSFCMIEGASAHSPKFIGHVSKTERPASTPVRNHIVIRFRPLLHQASRKLRYRYGNLHSGFGQGSQNAPVLRAAQEKSGHTSRNVDAAPGSPARGATLLETSTGATPRGAGSPAFRTPRLQTRAQRCKRCQALPLVRCLEPRRCPPAPATRLRATCSPRRA